jgi:hypothetical protein
MANHLETRTVPIADLVHFGKNPRRADIKAIKESLEQNVANTERSSSTAERWRY